MSNKWNAIAVAHGPRYAIQVDTWAHDVRANRGRPYVVCDYREVEDVGTFLRQRPALYRQALDACKDVGRLQCVLCDVDARFQKQVFVPPVDVCGIYLRDRKTYLPGFVVVRYTDAGLRFLDLWGQSDKDGDAERVTEAIQRARAEGVSVEDLPVGLVDFDEPGKPPSSDCAVKFLQEGWRDVRVTPELIGKASGGAAPVMVG